MGNPSIEANKLGENSLELMSKDRTCSIAHLSDFVDNL